MSMMTEQGLIDRLMAIKMASCDTSLEMDEIVKAFQDLRTERATALRLLERWETAYSTYSLSPNPKGQRGLEHEDKVEYVGTEEFLSPTREFLKKVK